MLKNKIIIILIMSVFCMFIITSAVQAEKATYTIKVATHHPESHQAIADLKIIKENVERETNGDIEMILYPGGQLGDYMAIYEEVMRGSIEMGHICLTGEYDNKLEINYMPYLFSTYSEIPQVLSPGSYFYSKYDELNNNLDIKLLGVYAEGFVGMGTNNLPNDYADPTVIKEMLIRVSPQDVIKLGIEAMGYRTVTIPYSDLYTALQSGVADGWFGGTSQLNYLSFRDAIKYYIPYNLCLENTAYVMNLEFFNSMPEEYQQIIENECQKAALRSFEYIQKLDKEYMQKLDEYGIQIVELSEDELSVIATHVVEQTWPVLAERFGQDIIDGLLSDIK